MDTEIQFSPLTIMIGRNGVGKTTILDVLQLIGNFARGGAQRAFGPPPWSLGWQRTKGIGTVGALRFELDAAVSSGLEYRYSLSLDEVRHEAKVQEERLMSLRDHRTIASFSWQNAPRSGTILSPDTDTADTADLREISGVFKSVVSYELNPASIERPVDPEHTYISREGFGVAGFLTKLKDEEPERFDRLEERLRGFRPETESIDIWSAGNKLYWGLRDQGQERAFPAPHLSWGDRQLVGLLCVLFFTKPGTTIAIEEIDRGFHHSRYRQVIDLISETSYDGLDGKSDIQIVVTTHSSSFINKLEDRIDEIQIVSRSPGGGTIVRPLKNVAAEKLGTAELSAPIGEVWEMGLLEDLAAA